jgi:hypothetical protein
MVIKSRVELVELMKHLKLPLVAAEVGVAEGKFATELYCRGLEKLYLVDIWEHIEETQGCSNYPTTWHEENYHDVKHRFYGNEKVVILKGFSSEMAKEIPDNSVGLCYIDADHSYEGAMSDIKAYYPKVVSGGIIATHDYMNEGYGVGRAVRDFIDRKDVVVIEEGEDVNGWSAYFIKK